MKTKKWKNHKYFGLSEKFYKENQRLFLNFFIQRKPNSAKNGLKLLDLGCMGGEFTKETAKVIGTDRTFGIEIVKKYANDARKRGIKVKKGDLNKRFPYPSKFFDVISANQVLEHLWNTDNFFKETNRVLKKGGYAVISVPNLSSCHSIFFILLGQQTPVLHLVPKQVGNFLSGTKIRQPEHMKAFNVPALMDLARLYGFKVERLEGFGFYFLPMFLQKIVSKLMKRYTVFLTMRIRKVRDYKKGH